VWGGAIKGAAMVQLKSERHHWWPKCVSKLWAAADGTAGWVRPDGSIRRVPPSRLGMIGNGHHIKLDPGGGSTPWDASFEDEFDRADTHFPRVISWLDSLQRFQVAGTIQDRYQSQTADDDLLVALTECVVSLAVRSPRNREASVAVAESLQGPLSEFDRNSVMGLNMRRSQRLVSDSIKSNGKFAAVFTSTREFIFGDGFFHNVTAPSIAPYHPQIVAPITPNLTVIVTRPMRYRSEPRLFTMVLSSEEVDIFNEAVQVYSRRSLFFRNDRPHIHDSFKRGDHMEYAPGGNPLSPFIQGLPGTLPRLGYFGAADFS
jgi:hypothetical protein